MDIKDYSPSDVFAKFKDADTYLLALKEQSEGFPRRRHSFETSSNINFLKDDVKMVSINGKSVDLRSGEPTIESRIENNVKEARTQSCRLGEKIRNPLCLEAAFIADHVYTGDGYLLGGWKVSKDFQDLKPRYNQRDINGLVSNLYSRRRNGKLEYVYATAGTDPTNPLDYIANISQFFGYSEQYDAALEIAIELDKRIKRKNGSLFFTGHSLGGGEATLNALCTNNHAFVFNPAGLSAKMKKNHQITMNIFDESSLIDSFIMTHDLLNVVQDIQEEIDEFPHAIGLRWYVEPESSSNFLNHGMKQLKDRLIKISPFKIRFL